MWSRTNRYMMTYDKGWRQNVISWSLLHWKSDTAASCSNQLWFAFHLLISSAWPPSSLLLPARFCENLSGKVSPKGSKGLHPTVMIYLSNSWWGASTPGQPLLSWLAAEGTHGTLDAQLTSSLAAHIDDGSKNSVGANLNQTPGIHVLRVQTI